ncbi:MAG: hypothetical protein JW747_10075 [Candidatus Aminicenantes bacterium]|nr:hypothetical protein [Candidatus Aminicenantes bacterium]
MKSLIRVLALSLLAAAFFMACASKPAPGPAMLSQSGWELLGRRQVNFSADRDTVVVTAARGSFTRLMIVVRDHALEMFNVKITFRNGDDFSPATRLVFGESTRSRVIDLPGGKRFVRKVDFNYESLGAGFDRADVEVWGK